MAKKTAVKRIRYALCSTLSFIPAPSGYAGSASATALTAGAVVVSVVRPAVMPPVIITMTIIVLLRAGLPDNRGHILLPGSGHGAVIIAPPLVAAGITRGAQKCAVILLLRRAGRYNRGNDVASLRVAILGCYAPVLSIIFHLACPRKHRATLPLPARAWGCVGCRPRCIIGRVIGSACPIIWGQPPVWVQAAACQPCPSYRQSWEQPLRARSCQNPRARWLRPEFWL